MSTDIGRLQREAIARRRPYAEFSIAHALVSEYEETGWIAGIRRARITRVRKDFDHDEVLENRVWYLMFLLGYPEISSGRKFKVRIARKGAEPLEKQIDVLAKDDETVIVAECKSSASITRRTLQKDLEEFANLKKPIANAISKHYGPEFKPKIIWLFVTSKQNDHPSDIVDESGFARMMSREAFAFPGSYASAGGVAAQTVR